MKPIYFRDFLSTFIARGGDISKITFRSNLLASKYRIIELKGGFLDCMRIRHNGAVEPAGFEWGRMSSTGVYSTFEIFKLEKNVVKLSALRKEVRIIAHLRRSELR